MSVIYYNGLDEEVRTTPKNHVYFESNSEKYASINGDADINNSNFSATNELQALRIKKMDDIDAKSDVLVASPFTYDNKQFPTDDKDISKYDTLFSIFKNGTPGATMMLRTIDRDIYTLVSANYETFFDNAFQHVNAIKGAGAVFLKACYDATDLTELKAVNDNR